MRISRRRCEWCWRSWDVFSGANGRGMVFGVLKNGRHEFQNVWHGWECYVNWKQRHGEEYEWCSRRISLTNSSKYDQDICWIRVVCHRQSFALLWQRQLSQILLSGGDAVIYPVYPLKCIPEHLYLCTLTNPPTIQTYRPSSVHAHL